MDKSPVLQIEDLSVSIGQKRILTSLELTVNPGEIVGIAGSSGSGKTMLAWTAMSMPPANATVTGSVLLRANGEAGQMLDARSAKYFLGRHIAIIPQNPFTSLNPSIRCGKQILENWDGPEAEGKLQCVKTLETLQFEDPLRIMQSFPHQLSGGQLQRVVMAMALINRPICLVADEVTTALDSITTRQVLDMLCKWAREHNSGLMLISHDIHTLDMYCDRVLTLENGSLRPGRPEYIPINTGKSYFSEDEETILSASHIHKTFAGGTGPVHAVSDVSFDIPSGQSLGIIGSSGSGKSTMARILVGLESVDSGELSFKDIPLEYSNKDLRGEIQMIFQDPYSSLYPHKSAGYCIEEAVILHEGLQGQLARRRTEQLLGEVGLEPDVYDRSTRQLSGGERQRIQIARALAVKPQVLICDECTSGLDIPVQAQILGLLNKLKDEGLTIIFISHDLNAVRFIADEIMVVDHGKVAEKGGLQEILKNPRSDIARALIEALE